MRARAGRGRWQPASVIGGVKALVILMSPQPLKPVGAPGFAAHAMVDGEHPARIVQILEEIGARPELARSHVSYARLLKARGAQELARGSLLHAVGMFREMGMAWDLERAEQALREL